MSSEALSFSKRACAQKHRVLPVTYRQVTKNKLLVMTTSTFSITSVAFVKNCESSLGHWQCTENLLYSAPNMLECVSGRCNNSFRLGTGKAKTFRSRLGSVDLVVLRCPLQQDLFACSHWICLHRKNVTLTKNKQVSNPFPPHQHPNSHLRKKTRMTTTTTTTTHTTNEQTPNNYLSTPSVCDPSRTRY